MTGVAVEFIAPLITAMTLGLTGPENFGHQTGRNEASNHARNIILWLMRNALRVRRSSFTLSMPCITADDGQG